MPDEEPTITVDLRDEGEEWVQYARNHGKSRSETEVNEQSLKAETRQNLRQAVRRYLEGLENNTLDIETRFELSDYQLFDRLSGIVIQRTRNVAAIREQIRNQLRADEDVSAFELPQRTREATAEHLVEVAVGKAEIRSLARLLLEREQAVLDTDEFEADTPRTGTSWVSEEVRTNTDSESNVENRTQLNSKG